MLIGQRNDLETQRVSVENALKVLQDQNQNETRVKDANEIAPDSDDIDILIQQSNSLEMKETIRKLQSKQIELTKSWELTNRLLQIATPALTSLIPTGKSTAICNNQAGIDGAAIQNGTVPKLEKKEIKPASPSTSASSSTSVHVHPSVFVEFSENSDDVVAFSTLPKPPPFLSMPPPARSSSSLPLVKTMLGTGPNEVRPNDIGPNEMAKSGNENENINSMAYDEAGNHSKKTVHSISSLEVIDRDEGHCVLETSTSQPVSATTEKKRKEIEVNDRTSDKNSEHRNRLAAKRTKVQRPPVNSIEPPNTSASVIISSDILEGGEKVWVPPKNQSGDGRTSLNDKYGY